MVATAVRCRLDPDFFLGVNLDAAATMTLTVSLSFPVVVQLGYDALLIGVLVVRMTDAPLITAPVGMRIDVLSDVTRDIPLSCWPTSVLLAVRALVLWLPRL
jgi:TRAP-type C4-dicarboxylate transport system permease large subunit